MSDKKRRILPAVVSSLFALLMVAGGIWLFTHRQYVQDLVDVWRYQPSSEVAALGSAITLTPKGEFIFYASHPEINEADDFNANCPQREVNNPILGCYDGRFIYVYNVAEIDLAGIQEVTAAHELLHAVWLRMSTADRERVGQLLTQAYNEMTDTSFRERMAYYERNEPGQLVNELHSIIGTEYATLSPELEAHYAQYMDDRSRVVAYHQQYASVFASLQAQVSTLYTQLTTLGKSIDAERSAYVSQSAQLTTDIESFNTRASQGAFSTQAQFYSERSALLQRSATLEAQRQSLNSEIAVYNQTYQEYQNVAGRIQQLNSSINSMDGVQQAPTVAE